MVYLFYNVRPEDIYLLKFLLESYENLMTVSTVDESIPKIQITVAPDFLEDCVKILKDMETRFEMSQVDEPSNISQGHY